MQTGELKGPFKATILATLAGLRELHGILLAEQKALLGNDAEALEQLVAQKNHALGEIGPSIQAREQMLQQAGLPGGLVGTEQFISTHFSPAEMLPDWEALVSLSREVEELNVHNGKLARAGERTTREALTILTGRPQSADTYSRKGAQHGELSGYSLGKC